MCTSGRLSYVMEEEKVGRYVWYAVQKIGRHHIVQNHVEHVKCLVLV